MGGIHLPFQHLVPFLHDTPEHLSRQVPSRHFQKVWHQLSLLHLPITTGTLLVSLQAPSATPIQSLCKQSLEQAWQAKVKFFHSPFLLQAQNRGLQRAMKLSAHFLKSGCEQAWIHPLYFVYISQGLHIGSPGKTVLQQGSVKGLPTLISGMSPSHRPEMQPEVVRSWHAEHLEPKYCQFPLAEPQAQTYSSTKSPNTSSQSSSNCLSHTQMQPFYLVNTCPAAHLLTPPIEKIGEGMAVEEFMVRVVKFFCWFMKSVRFTIAPSDELSRRKANNSSNEEFYFISLIYIRVFISIAKSSMISSIKIMNFQFYNQKAHKIMVNHFLSLLSKEEKSLNEIQGAVCYSYYIAVIFTKICLSSLQSLSKQLLTLQQGTALRESEVNLPCHSIHPPLPFGSAKDTCNNLLKLIPWPSSVAYFSLSLKVYRVQFLMMGAGQVGRMVLV